MGFQRGTEGQYTVQKERDGNPTEDILGECFESTHIVVSNRRSAEDRRTSAGVDMLLFFRYLQVIVVHLHPCAK